MPGNTEQVIRTFIAENFLFTDEIDDLDGAVSLLEADIINSTGVLELILFLEECFNIKVEDDEVIPENLDSVNAILAYLPTKLSHTDVKKSA